MPREIIMSLLLNRLHKGTRHRRSGDAVLIAGMQLAFHIMYTYCIPVYHTGGKECDFSITGC